MLATYDLRMTMLMRPTAGFTAVREVAFPLLAVAVIVASTDIRMPLGLPGHRGLIWLTLLVAVALVTARRETVLAVGAASSIAALPIHGLSDPLWSSRYVAAAALLLAVGSVPVVRLRRWLLALAAAPIHLVALASSVASGHTMSAWVSNAMLERAGWHAIFGLVAGLFAWGVALGVGGPIAARATGAGSATRRLKERPL